MAQYILGGPTRFAHQRAGLKRLIETGGQCALLFEPGLGKTATTFDYLGLLALKSEQVVDGEREARVLVISPKAAVDTWVLQAEKWVSPMVNVWSEALGGSIAQKAETMISRGPRTYKPRAVRRSKDLKQLPHRALNVDRADIVYASTDDEIRGPGDLRGKPRLIILSTNLETFARRDRHGTGTIADYLVAAVERFQPDAIVVDELHKIKGATSNTSRLIARLGARTKRRIGLTGTVMPHSPMDVFGQWRFIQPTAFGRINTSTRELMPATFDGFRKRFGVLGGYMGTEVISYRDLDVMQKIMAENSIVALKKDALDLPKMKDTELVFSLSRKEQKLYGAMKRDLAAQVRDGTGIGGTASAPNRLTQLLRLRQITAGHLPLEDGTVEQVGSSKVDAITSLIEDTLEGENRIVVFALFTAEIKALAEKLNTGGNEVMVIDGSTPEARRRAYRQRFGSKAPERIILVAQVSTISVSVNELVTANHAIFATLSQRRDDLIQARDRLNRIGQERPCTFWYALAKDTVDEVIYESHKKMTDLETQMMKHIQSSDSRKLARIVG